MSLFIFPVLTVPGTYALKFKNQGVFSENVRTLVFKEFSCNIFYTSQPKSFIDPNMESKLEF